MARIDTLIHFLDDVADAIRVKTGGTADIPASSFDTEILNIVIPEIEPSKNVIPTTSSQIIGPSNGYDAMSEIIVSAVTNTIDQNIVPGNIKKDVVILGITGTFEGGTLSPEDYSRCLQLTEDILGVIGPETTAVVGPVLNDILGVTETNEQGGSIKDLDTLLDDIFGGDS